MIYKKFDIVVVPFPFVDSPLSKPRPAIVLSSEDFQRRNAHVHLGMITTAHNTKWKDDIFLSDLSTTGLSVTSFFRPKIFTLPESLLRKKIGEVSQKDREKINIT
jgi:mRNA interferase MazF